MLTFAFFIATFASASWVIYALMYISARLGEATFTSLSLQESSGYMALVLLPVLMIWMIFGYAQQFFSIKFVDRKTYKLLQQMKKNQDYSDLMVRILIDTGHEIKDGFILNKFDLFISDMNEMLADILIRCNLVSSGQLENLWNKVLHGERWSIAKILISSTPAGYSISEKIFEYAKRDQIIAGTLMEFCSRYQMLITLLEKHDQNGIFSNIVQTGVMGKAYSILAPISEQIQYGANGKNFEASSEKITTAVIEGCKENSDNKRSFVSSVTSIFRKKDKSDENDDEQEEEFLSSGNGEKIEPSFSMSAEDNNFVNAKIDNTPENEKEELKYPFGE